MNEQRPLPLRVAVLALARCAAATVVLLLRRRTHLRRRHLGRRLAFGDGTSAPVYRETVVDIDPTEPCMLFVKFRLRWLRGLGHTLFRYESLLNTPLFVGFPGLVSKLWLAHDGNGVYRGVYEWDRPEAAEHYARCLWHVLALVCVPGSIAYRVVPGVRRDEVLRDPDRLGAFVTGAPDSWWRIVEPQHGRPSPSADYFLAPTSTL